MASRIIHLAVAEEIIKRENIDDVSRFRLGSILPDAKIDSALRAAPHFQITLPGGLLTYDLSRWRKLFGERMLRDGLYLGYYLHLLQDMVYRNFMYALPRWDERIPENVRMLHSDYRKINRYIIESRGLVNSVPAPADFGSEELNLMFGFDLKRFLSELDADFSIIQEGDYHFFTPQMADEFITLALEACMHELKALRYGLPLCDEYSMAWGKE